MNHRTLLSRLISPAGFALIVLLFLLPFVTVSCGSDPALDATFSGLDMISGGEPDVTGDVGGGPIDEETKRELFALFSDDLDVQPLAVLAVLAVLGAMMASLLPGRVARHGGAAMLATLAAILLTAAVVASRDRVDDAAAAKSVMLGGSLPPTTIQPRYGFWLVLLSLVAAAAAHATAWVKARREAVAQLSPNEPRGDAGPELLDFGS